MEIEQKLEHWDLYQENILYLWKWHVPFRKSFSLSVTPCYSSIYYNLDWRNIFTQFPCQACAIDVASIHTTIHMSSDGRIERIYFPWSGNCLTSRKGTYLPINIAHNFRNVKLVWTSKCAHFKISEGDR